MSFERHATSKIRQVQRPVRYPNYGVQGDVWRPSPLSPMWRCAPGASPMNWHLIQIEGSGVKDRRRANAPAAPPISVKNLFFNVPARRNFLKSILSRCATSWNSAHRHCQSGCFFSPATTMAAKCSICPPSNLRRQLDRHLRRPFQQKLVPVTGRDRYPEITGLVGKPEFAKTRGEQYFYVNNRFIKNLLPEPCRGSAFENLLPQTIRCM